jgi:diacylglycerol kinase (ATP)
MPGEGGEPDVILVFGGDGTVHRHLGLLVRLGLPVLVVPAGSGNDFARALGLRSVRDSVAAWRKYCDGRANVRSIDLGAIVAVVSAGEAPAPHGLHYFCCVAGCGLDSEVARRANDLPRWLRGNGGYALSLIPTIFQFAPVAMKISVGNSPLLATEARGGAPGLAAGELSDSVQHDGENSWAVRSDRPTLLAAFANTPVYGGGMKIAPRARFDDGLLDVCVVGGVDPVKLLCLFPTVYAGRHLGIREVEYFQSTHVRVETEHPLDVYADGEFVCRTPVEVGVQSSALRVLTG